MDIVRYRVRLTGTQPLLQHAFGDSGKLDAKGAKHKKASEMTPLEVATLGTYQQIIEGEMRYCVPLSSILKAMRSVGSFFKVPNQRKGVATILVGAVATDDEYAPLVHPETRKYLDRFEVDSRAVRNAVTNGRTLCHRPKWPEWSVEFTLTVNRSVIDTQTVLQCLQYAGEMAGIGAFRRSSGGPFGKFAVTGYDFVDSVAPVAIDFHDDAPPAVSAPETPAKAKKEKKEPKEKNPNAVKQRHIPAAI